MNLLSIFLGEFIGTMILIILGNGVVSNMLYKRTKGYNSGSIVIYMAWGFAVLVGVLIAKSFIEGAGHLNPAVSMFALVKGDITFLEFSVFVGSQLLGAAIGQIIVNTVYWQCANEESNKQVILDCHANSPTHQEKWFNNFFAEFLGTMVLLTVLAVLSSNVFQDKMGMSHEVVIILHTLMAAFTIMVIGMSLGGVTGYSINPARDLMPRIVYQLTPFKNKGSANWTYSWLPVVAPLSAGAFVGAFARLITKS